MVNEQCNAGVGKEACQLAQEETAFLRCCLVAENNLSDGVDDACPHIYLPDRSERMEKVDPFFHYRLTGSLVMDREGKFL